jgi:sensor histidine kinase YesM
MNIPKNWRLRLIVATLLSVMGFFIRLSVVKLHLTFLQNFGLMFFTWSIIVLVWTFFANINQQLDKVLPFNKNTPLRIIIQLFTGTTLLLIIRMIGREVVGDRFPYHPDEITRVILSAMDVFIALTVNLAVISNYIIHRWKETLIRAEKLEQEKIRMQYHHLKNQVNPHFLFNSFSSLQGLINSNPKLANEYIGHLAKVYRYVIQNKENEIVPIQTELEFIQHYIDLLKIRYGEGIQIHNKLTEENRSKGIVTVTLQMLIDNAIKHNEIHPEKPLHITFGVNQNILEVSNSLQTRPSMIPSNGEGLIQLTNLYAFHSSIPVTYTQEVNEFIVKLPLLNIY